MEGYIAEVRYFAGNFAPSGWMFCKGQELSIAMYGVLYSLLGTTYGGDGQTTFKLPDFAGRAGVGTGQGAGLTPRVLGEVFGTERVTLLTTQIPAHQHGTSTPVSGLTLKVGPADATKTDPVAGDYLASLNEGAVNYLGYTTATPDTTLAAQSLDMSGMTANTSPTGGSLSHENMQPFMALNYIICVEGIYPSRN